MYWVFYIGLGLLFTHELDAVRNNEWRVLPLTSWLPEQYGEDIFILLHIPLFAVLIYFLASEKLSTRQLSRTIAAAFMALHGVLHWLFSSHVHYEFEAISSSSFIYGAAVCGLIYLLADFRGRQVAANT